MTDRSIEATITAPKQTAVPTPEAIGEIVAEGSAQEGESAQTLEAQTVQRPTEAYYVQWGAYAKRVNAEEMVALLNERGAEAFVEHDKGLDRVLAGPFSEYNNAKAEIERLCQKIGRSYWIFRVGSSKQTSSR